MNNLLPGVETFLVTGLLEWRPPSSSTLSIVEVEEVVEAAPIPGIALLLGLFFDPPPFLMALRTEMDLLTGDPAARLECRAA